MKPSNNLEKVCYDLFNHLGSYIKICSFRLVLEGKTGKEMPELPRLQFLKKFLANNFVLSDAEGITSGLLNGKGIAYLPLLRALLAIHNKSQEPSFCKMMGSFVLLSYASLTASNPFWNNH